MPIILDGTAGITNDSGYTGDGVSFADSTPANTLVTTAGGNVGIGTSSPASRLDVEAPACQIAVTSTTGTNGSFLRLNNTAGYVFVGRDNSTGSSFGAPYGAVFWANGAHPMLFATNDSERMRIDSSGNLLVGRTSQLDFGKFCLNYSGTTNNGIIFDDTTAAGTSSACIFKRAGTNVGAINTTATTTSYVTSSDYRLKENIEPMTGALAKVAALKPVTYTWKATGEADEGFIAHELAEVCPSAVVGEKDAVDAEGNPQYQGIDTSFLVATLTAALQELKAINDAQAQTIESLTARVVALEQA